MQVHILNREIAYWAMRMFQYGVPVGILESLTVMLSKIVFGDTAKYGIARPKEGPFAMKAKYGKYPVLDVGTYKKIKAGEIQVSLIANVTSPDLTFFKAAFMERKFSSGSASGLNIIAELIP